MPLFHKLVISSSDLTPLASIPGVFSADGGNTTPAIAIAGVPVAATELAVIVHDPDAPLPNGFTHWTVYGIPTHATLLDLAADGVRVGPNGAGQAAWYGPQPRANHGMHHYYFWVYALSRPVDGTPSSREQFLVDYADAVVEQARFVGTFEN